MPRPIFLVLAGVNGAGKSSIGGHLLHEAGLTWFNPDTFARELMIQTGCSQEHANGEAWRENVRRIDEALADAANYACETTLGGSTIPSRIRTASATHDVHIWYCGLSSVDLHIRRVRARVAAGGHDIPDGKIRERYTKSVRNLIGLLPHVSHVQVYDNSREAGPGGAVPDPILVLEWKKGKVTIPSPKNPRALTATPDWAKAIVEAALRLAP